MTRRIALFTDVHGNLHALDAVLADISDAGASEVYCLGDLVGYGPDPAGVIERIRESGIPTIRGNYDDGVGGRRGECGCYYATDQAKTDGAASYAFTDSVLDDADHLWLVALPDEIRLEEATARILLVHGSPRRVNEYLLLDRPEHQLIRLAQEADADVVCVGHVHIPYHRSMTSESGSRIHYVSAGSVGKPKDGDPRASWIEMLLGPKGEVRRLAPADGAASAIGKSDLWLGMVAHRVDYDIESVASAMMAAGLPATLAIALRNA